MSSRKSISGIMSWQVMGLVLFFTAALFAVWLANEIRDFRSSVTESRKDLLLSRKCSG